MKFRIDLGSHEGATLHAFMSRPHHKEFEVHAFEPNPHVSTIRYPSRVIVHRAAAWILDGTCDLYVSKDQRGGVWSSVLRNKSTGNLDTQHPVSVECIDFSRWLQQLVKPGRGDYVSVKMDIEGAEYLVLSEMILENTIGLINDLYVERHADRVGISGFCDRSLFETIAKKGVRVHAHT